MVSFNNFSGAPFLEMIWAVMMETEMSHIKMPDYSPTPAGQDGQNVHISSTSLLLPCW